MSTRRLRSAAGTVFCAGVGRFVEPLRSSRLPDRRPYPSRGEKSPVRCLAESYRRITVRHFFLQQALVDSVAGAGAALAARKCPESPGKRGFVPDEFA